MRIQVIQYSNSSLATENDGILYSPMYSPRALDDYDINIIDLSVKYISNSLTYNRISLITGVRNASKAT